MPRDISHATVVIRATFDDVLATVRDVGRQPEWVKEITAAEVLEEYEDGTVATARFTMVSKLGSDSYTLEYDHGDDRMTWTMVDSDVLRGQVGSYVLRDLDEEQTEATLTLDVEHDIRAPGFVRRRVFDSFVRSNANGLKGYLESGVDG